MALVSRQKNFIYLKTFRTASTTTEKYFEVECVPPAMRGTMSVSYERANVPEIVTEYGVVGARGTFMAGEKRPAYFNHMSAAALKKRVGDEFFDSAFKFCNVRNPFDKLVSAFWKRLPRTEAARLKTCDFSVVRTSFKTWLLRSDRLKTDANKYILDGKVCMDDYIRYEELCGDIERICKLLDMSFDRDRVLHFGGRARNNTPRRYESYYDFEARSLVEDLYAFELERFGYGFGE